MTRKSESYESVRSKVKNSGLSLIVGLVGFFLFTLFKLSGVGILLLISGIGYWFYISRQIKKLSVDPEYKAIIDQVKLDIKEERSQAKQTKSILVKYEVGLEHLSLNGSYTLYSAQDGLQLRKTFGKETIKIPWSDLLEIESGSEADLRSRVTLSRLLLVGIFAFGLKKERKKAFYISIATPDSVGLFEVNTSGSNNRMNEKKARVFATACNARIKSTYPSLKNQSQKISSTNYDEIEKLGELLEKGLLTKSEFESKKKQILGL